MWRQIALPILLVLFGTTTFSNLAVHTDDYHTTTLGAANAAVTNAVVFDVVAAGSTTTTTRNAPNRITSAASSPPALAAAIARASAPQRITINLPTYAPVLIKTLSSTTTSSNSTVKNVVTTTRATTSSSIVVQNNNRTSNAAVSSLRTTKKDSFGSESRHNNNAINTNNLLVPSTVSLAARSGPSSSSSNAATSKRSSPNVIPPSTRPPLPGTAVQTIPAVRSIIASAAAASQNAIPNTDKPTTASSSPIATQASAAAAPQQPAPKSVRGTAPTDAYECPKDEYFQLFPTRCTKHSECRPRNGDEFRCCKQIGGRRCVKAIARPVPEPKHEPILGVIPRKCPREPLAELFWDLQTCDTDRDCWPRVCCPDGAHKYCRTAQPDLEKSTLSVARQLSTPLESVSKYIQCTPPPPAVFDMFPKKCNSTLDCFPNVCCQEAGRKHCRPPRRSLLSLLTGFASRFNTGVIRQWAENIVIR